MQTSDAGTALVPLSLESGEVDGRSRLAMANSFRGQIRRDKKTHRGGETTLARPRAEISA